MFQCYDNRLKQGYVDENLAGFTFKELPEGVNCVTPSGRCVIGDTAGNVHVYFTERSWTRRQIHEGVITCIISSNDTSIIVGTDAGIKVWDITEMNIVTIHMYEYAVTSLLIISDILIVGYADGSIYLFSMPHYTRLTRIGTHTSRIVGLARISDEAFVSASSDHIFVWACP